MFADNFYEVFQVGQTLPSSGRQITDADVRLLFGMVGGTHPLHIDPIYCASRPEIGKPIAPGSLVLGIVEGFFSKDICPDDHVYAQPILCKKIRFLKPIYIGDVVSASFEVKEKHDMDEFSGQVLFGISVYNQKDEIVTYVEEGFRIEKREKGGKD
ncbi:MaoC family dehydratase [Hominifimenecus sp. rT4P-3]|uniref:MaoC family dehydratase n=1 Tax=Hominifimenecus sp. rT4P-3 TaxID=3242979 RepID=UPI003DA1E442